MNYEKWQSKDIPLSILALKLAEEAAEVGTEISDAAIAPSGIRNTVDVQRLGLMNRKDAILAELEHVRHLCDVIEDRLKTRNRPHLRA
jgi:hypothetical protein